MRHAKAETGTPGQRDFDRPLAARGREDAERMGRALDKLGAVPDAIVASSAVRAKDTAEIAARAMKFGGAVHLERALYAAPGDVWIQALNAVPASAGSVLVVAHSPGISEAAGALCAAPPRAFDVPTAGLIALAADVDRWRDLEGGEAWLRWFLRPKMVGAL